MIDALRHSEIYNPEDYAGKRVAIIGVGTIGSHLALTLARMQVPMTLYDHDTIEQHNLATQSYTRRDIGAYKVDAVRRQCEAIGAEEDSVRAKAEQYESQDDTEYDFIVSCVDSLDARRAIATRLIEGVDEHWSVPMAERLRNMPIHDGRVGAEQVEVYRYENAQAWLDGLPATADTDPCGARFTAYTANICAGLLANNIKRELLGQTVQPRILYDAFSSSFLKP